VRAHVSGPVHAVNALFENSGWVAFYRRTYSLPRPAKAVWPLSKN
jgi:hypothetical protein